MTGRLGRLGADSAIYGIGTVAGRFLNFILVPFYTNVLRPDEYGVVAYLYSLIAFANIVYWMGMEPAYFKFATGTADRRPAFASGLTLVGAVALAISAAAALGSAPLAALLEIPGQERLVVYSAGILLLDAIAVIPFASLRLEGKAGAFAAIKFGHILLNVSANVTLIVGYGYGVEGVFVGGLIASGASILLLLPFVSLRGFTPSKALMGQMMKFGLPTVPAGMAMIALQVVDRPILLHLTGAATVGLYQASYRLGIIMMAAVSIFEYAWKPFLFKHANDPDAKQLFSRVVTSLAGVLFPLMVVLVFFLPDVARLELFGVHVIHPDYWPGLAVVPLVLLGYLFLGLATGFSAGIYIAGKTHYLPMIGGAAAIVKVGLNLLLIPSLGIIGAGWATAAAYFVVAVLYYYAAGRVYPVEYDTRRITRIALASMGVILVFSVIPEVDYPLSILVKAGVLLLLPLLLFLFGVLRPAEVSTILRSLLSRSQR